MVIGQMQALRRSILAAALAALALAIGAWCAWAVGLVVSDRLRWTQPVAFVPRQFFVWPAGVGWVLFAGLSLLYSAFRPRAEGVPWRSERRARSRLPRLLGRARAVVGVLVLLATLHLVVADWRLPMNARLRPPPDAERLRIIHWNVGWSHPDEVHGALVARGPDLAIIVNPHTRRDLRFDFDALARTMGGDGGEVRDWPIIVVSRFPMLRRGTTQLGFTATVAVEPGLRTEGLDPPRDPGHATFIELDAGPPFDRPIVVWILDLPSDPALSRPAVVRQAVSRINAWVGPDNQGFPEPDVIIGDLNIPAGASSLMGLRRRSWGVMQDAAAQGGVGPMATWPHPRPLLRIDQCFVGRGARAAWYGVEAAAQTKHLMQIVDLVPEG